MAYPTSYQSWLCTSISTVLISVSCLLKLLSINYRPATLQQLHYLILSIMLGVDQEIREVEIQCDLNEVSKTRELGIQCDLGEVKMTRIKLEFKMTRLILQAQMSG